MFKRLFPNYTKKVGMQPGALVHISADLPEPTTISLTEYDSDYIETRIIQDPTDAFNFLDSPSITWIDVCGFKDIRIFEKIGDYCGIHSLMLEDILNANQRPKVEIFDDYILFIFKEISYDEKLEDFKINQLSLILGNNYVITFREHPSQFFHPLLDNLRLNKGKIRKLGADYLAYSIIDLIVDNYFLFLERLGDVTEEVESSVLGEVESNTVVKIQALKSKLIFLRRAVWPLREELLGILREEHKLIKSNTLPYLHDLYDHTIHVIDTLETYREFVSGLLDVYLSKMSNRMNEIMKVLTIISTVFIPLTFLVGVYGMNFAHMPELNLPWAYPAIWGVFVLIVLGMYWFFKKKGWM